MIEKDNNAMFSGDAIRRFLLGQLNSTEQSAFEQTLFTDSQLESRVRWAELELADDYACGRLTSAESKQLRENFLVTSERRQMLGVSEALNDRFTSNSRPVRIARNLKAVFDFSQPAWRYAFATMILLIIFAAVWLRVKEPKRLVEVFVPKRVSPKPAPTQAPDVSHHGAAPSVPVHVEEATPPPDHQLAIAIVLNGENTSGNPFEVKLPAAPVNLIHFQIPISQNAISSYHVELWNSRGQSLLSANSLRAAEAGNLAFDVSSAVLTPGDYLIRLSPSAPPDGPVVAYFVRVRN